MNKSYKLGTEAAENYKGSHWKNVDMAYLAKTITLNNKDFTEKQKVDFFKGFMCRAKKNLSKFNKEEKVKNAIFREFSSKKALVSIGYDIAKHLYQNNLDAWILSNKNMEWIRYVGGVKILEGIEESIVNRWETKHWNILLKEVEKARKFVIRSQIRLYKNYLKTNYDFEEKEKKENAE